MAIKKGTFKGGVHPKEMKHLSETKGIVKLDAPELVYIPLSQHTGVPAKPLVKKKDEVFVGTPIGEAQGFVSAYVHSSVSGKVKDVKMHPSPLGRKCLL